MPEDRSIRRLADVARLLVAAVFLVAAIGKLLRPAAAAVELEHLLHIPPPVALFAGLALIVLELAAAMLLLRRETTGLGASLGAVLAFGFLANALGKDLASASPCHCFGAFGGLTPIEDLRLSLGLLVPCLGLCWYDEGAARGRSAAWPELTRRARVVQLLALAVVVAMAGVAWAAARPGSAARRVVNPAVPIIRCGETLPGWQLSDLSGRAIDPTDPQGCPTLLLFVSDGCQPCERLLAGLPPVRPLQRLRMVLAVATASGDSATPAVAGSVAQRAGFTGVVAGAGAAELQASVFGSPLVWPSAVLLDAEGRVAAAPAAASLPPEAVLRSIRAALADQPYGAEGPDILVGLGRRPPEVTVADAGGAMVPLASLVSGQRTILAVVDPDCGTCQLLLDRLAQHAAELADVAVVLVTGDRGWTAAVREQAVALQRCRVVVCGRRELQHHGLGLTDSVAFVDGRTVQVARGGEPFAVDHLLSTMLRGEGPREEVTE